MREKYDAIVIGGGHNSLVAACYLAKENKKVLLLERNPTLGGATASVYAFDGVAAKLSRYSYLVALLPDQIRSDLGLNFETISRTVSSYTPARDSGILVNRVFDDISRNSISNFTKNETDSVSWEKFYDRIAEFAKKVAPTMLEPLPTSSQIRSLVGEDLWQEFVETPLCKTLDKYFVDDVVKGINHVIDNYDEFRNKSLKTALEKDWNKIVPLSKEEDKKNKDISKHIVSVYDERGERRNKTEIAKDIIDLLK